MLTENVQIGPEYSDNDIEAARKEQSLLEQQRDSARLHVQAILAQLSFDTDLDVVTQSASTGDAASQPQLPGYPVH